MCGGCAGVAFCRHGFARDEHVRGIEGGSSLGLVALLRGLGCVSCNLVVGEQAGIRRRGTGLMTPTMPFILHESMAVQ